MRDLFEGTPASVTTDRDRAGSESRAAAAGHAALCEELSSREEP